MPLLITLIKRRVYFPSKAKENPPNVIVDISVNQGNLIPIWQALSQGGEEKYPFDNIIPEITNLKPRYIRIDHIYDFYNVVKKENGHLIFNWTELDKIVNQILKIGSLPFLSLSYMPPAIAKEGEITNQPENWQEWTTVVKETIKHYSGKEQKNLPNVIYEVWNEPDLFGNWKIGGKKDYRLLYKYAVTEVNQIKNVNNFKIGGPAITAPYKNWIDEFLNFIAQNKLRIDFYSWHRYSSNPSKFQEDIDKIDTWIFNNSSFFIEKYITEWGVSSEPSPINDSYYAASHLISTISQLLQRVDLAFTFEIKDGPSPNQEKYWGRWGILTHESTGTPEKKPKYYGLELLNKMKGDRILLTSEGNRIKGFAAKENATIRIILTNIDSTNSHFERVPLTIKNLENGNYSYQESFLRGQGKKITKTVNNENLQEEVFLSPNNIVVIELKKT